MRHGGAPQRLPRLSEGRSSRGEGQVREGMGRRARRCSGPHPPGNPGRRHGRADPGDLPGRREPRPERSGRDARTRSDGEGGLPGRAGHLPDGVGGVCRRGPARVEFRREGRDVHEHGTSRAAGAEGNSAGGRFPGRRLDHLRDRPAHGSFRVRLRERGRGDGRDRLPHAELRRDHARTDRAGRSAVALPGRLASWNALSPRRDVPPPERPWSFLPPAVPPARRGARRRVPARAHDRA